MTKKELRLFQLASEFQQVEKESREERFLSMADYFLEQFDGYKISDVEAAADPELKKLIKVLKPYIYKILAPKEKVLACIISKRLKEYS
jgi:hypothetical protein